MAVSGYQAASQPRVAWNAWLWLWFLAGMSVSQAAH